jgi:hypothetical protein
MVMDIDEDKIDEAVLALMYITQHEHREYESKSTGQ